VWLVAALAAGCGGPSTAEWIAQLQAPESSQRIHAVRALAARTGEAEAAVPALTEALQDRDAFVRRDAASALGGFGPEAREALPALRRLLRDPNAGVRRAAAGALKKIDPEAAARVQLR
jgi:HEAT repeat protein